MLILNNLFSEQVDRLLSVCNQRLYLLSQLQWKQGLADKCSGIVYDALSLVLGKVLYALSGWGGYVSQTQKDRIDASFRKACKWRLTSKLYNFDELLFEADRKLFARSKADSHCLHHMLPPSRASLQVALRPRGHNYDVPRVTFSVCELVYTGRRMYYVVLVSMLIK